MASYDKGDKLVDVINTSILRELFSSSEKFSQHIKVNIVVPDNSDLIKEFEVNNTANKIFKLAIEKGFYVEFIFEPENYVKNKVKRPFEINVNIGEFDNRMDWSSYEQG